MRATFCCGSEATRTDTPRTSCAQVRGGVSTTTDWCTHAPAVRRTTPHCRVRSSAVALAAAVALARKRASRVRAIGARRGGATRSTEVASSTCGREPVPHAQGNSGVARATAAVLSLPRHRQALAAEVRSHRVGGQGVWVLLRLARGCAAMRQLQAAARAGADGVVVRVRRPQALAPRAHSSSTRTGRWQLFISSGFGFALGWDFLCVFGARGRAGVVPRCLARAPLGLRAARARHTRLPHDCGVDRQQSQGAGVALLLSSPLRPRPARGLGFGLGLGLGLGLSKRRALGGTIHNMSLGCRWPV